MASTSTTVGGPSKIVTWVLRTVVVGYLFFLVAWPSGYVVKHTFATPRVSLPIRSDTPERPPAWVRRTVGAAS